MKLTGIIVLLIALSACTQQKLTHSECVVAHESGFVDTTGNRQHITVAENGSPCVIVVTSGRGRIGLGGQIGTPPAHGTASVNDETEATLISYTPARDYVGEDSFEVIFGPDFNETVLVQVVPITTSPTSPR
jgi:Bacterial Ig domain